MTAKRKRGTAYDPTKIAKRRKRGESVLIRGRWRQGYPFGNSLDLHAAPIVPNRRSLLTPDPASVPDSSPDPHPHGSFDEDQFFKVRTVLAERVVGRKTQYRIDWEDDERTGEKFAPTWEPKENLTETALADWEKLKPANQADPLAGLGSSIYKSQATPARAPVKRGKVRRVLPSSSQLPSSSAAEGNPAATADSPTSPIEIEESPDASSARPVFHNTGGDSPLFVSEDESLVIPSQDLAFVRPSDPPSSYQDYETLGSSQIGSVVAKSALSQSLPNSGNTLEVIEETTTETPAVFASSQNDAPISHTPAQPSTGRVVPDSQSLPTSINFVSQPQTNQDLGDSEEAASQLVGDLQVAAETFAAAPNSSTNLDPVPGQPSSQLSDRQPQSGNDLSGTPVDAVIDIDSPGKPDSQQQLAQQGLVDSQNQVDGPERAILVTSGSSQIAPTVDFSSQIGYRESIEDPASQARLPVTDRIAQHQSQEGEGSETQVSFPFETQTAPAQTQVAAATTVKPLQLSHSQPTRERNRTARSTLESPLRAQSLPGQNESFFSSFPAVPSHTLPTIGGSAPPPPYVPSTPTRSSAERTYTMERKTPTSEPRVRMADKIKAMKAEQAAKRAQTPSNASSQITPAKPSAVPPRLNAEIAAESPARTGTPESSRNGVRSPSAVPAALPIQTVTQDEMNTSGRYKTLVPQETENPFLRRQSTITGTASKEVSKLGNFVHSVPIALMGHQRDSYPLMIQHHKDIIERFLATAQPSDELIVEIETLLERLRRIAVHPDLDNIETYTQYDVLPAVHAKWATDCSAKFNFLKSLIDELRDKPVSIAVICRSGQLLQIVEDFLRGFKVSYSKGFAGNQTEQNGDGLKFKIISPTEDADPGSLAADAVICMDNSAEAGGPALKLLQDRSLVMMALVVPGTIEHVERCLSTTLTPQQKLRALVHGIFDLRYESGKLEYGQLPSIETAKVLADFITSDATAREWSVPALSMLENLDSQTESDIELPPSGVETHGGEKRPFGSIDIEMSASDTFKRPRLASNGVHTQDQPITINPLELDISHVSDSINKPSHPLVNSSDLAGSSVPNETVARLQSLLLSTRTELDMHKQDLSDLQYRYEDQRAQIVSLTRKNDEAIDTAQKAVTRMSEGAATASALRIENRSLKDQLKAAQDALADHSVPERAELEQQRIAFRQAQTEKDVLEKRLKTSQKDLDYAQEMYQNSSSAAQHLGTTNRELENALSHSQNRASGEQTRAKQMTLDARAQNLTRENKQLKAKLNEQNDALARKDKELGLLKEASRGRMGTRGSSQPRSPRMASPMKHAAGSRQTSPSASELRGRVHPLRQG